MIVLLLAMTVVILVGTCEASRFHSNSNQTIPIRFKSDGLIQNLKLQPLRRCNWDLFYVYDFMFM